MNLPDDFKEFIGFLDARGVDYAVVGGYALAFHGHPRFTGDLDVLIRPTDANAQAVLQALRDFGFGELELSVRDFTAPNMVVQLGRPPLRIDLITSIDGVPTDQVLANRTLDATGAPAVYVISRDDLVANKRAANRPQDIADLEKLLRESPKRP